MKEPPAYFEAIRQKAARRWDQLEQDPDLAGPWHQLFRQVQSPRHILSELLQNADDAGATEASVRIEDQVFTFEHDGEDFSEEHFASLCRFGYSNKRSLHTIGFRGVGFKSTFSLGDQVDLHTPSLSVRFHGRRFTEPQWLASEADAKGRTRVQVVISDQHRQREVEKNLEEWFESPFSLLFFKNIRRLWVGGQEVHWSSLGPGDVPASEWMALNEDPDAAFLLIRSGVEAFPDDALSEIRHERMLGADEETDFPPCGVEILLGAKGRLYVVLPTGVETMLPFACNAPFIQDPARLKIKDPETSPTNRWLLERAGKLAASAMLHWLNRAVTTTAGRAPAYGLLPDVDREAGSLEGVCGRLVEEAFDNGIEDKDILLTADGRLVPATRSVVLPGAVLDVWAPEQAAALLDEEARPPLCQHIDAADRKKLLRWGLVEEIDRQKLLAVLQSKHLPKPETWRQLLNLWAYVAPEIIGYRHYVSAEDVRIVPVQGKDVLHAASEVVRLGEKKLLQSDDDWSFLAKYLVVLNQNWPRFLAEQRRTASDRNESTSREAAEAAYAVLRKIGLDDSSDVSKIIDRISSDLFAQDDVAISECVQLAQIAAKLNARVGETFEFVTRDGYRRPAAQGILFDEDGRLEDLLPQEQREAELLHASYFNFTSCSRDEWKSWISSGKSGLLTTPAIKRKEYAFSSREAFLRELQRVTGYRGSLSFPYTSHRSYPYQRYYLIDFDFDSELTKYWSSLSPDSQLWSTVAALLLETSSKVWQGTTAVLAKQTSTNGQSKAEVHFEQLPAAWLRRLASVECLRDTRGVLRRPIDLLRRTPETEALMDLELFVHGSMDTEATRPLLELLGVRSTPTGPDRLLDCLRSLGKAEKPPVQEVEKWYRRLDQMVESCSTADFQRIKQAFGSERLILTHDGAWATTSAAFLSSDDEDAPDAALIRTSVSDLTLWQKLGVAERPTADLAIQWLKLMPSGEALSQTDARRVRALLVRHPTRIWEECGHWLNLAGEWVPVDTLSYGLTMQSLTPWRHLHPWVKQKTGDFQRLPSETTTKPPFSELTPLSTHVEERFQNKPLIAGQLTNKAWLRTFGAELCRVEFDTAEETGRVRAVAELLAETGWLETPGLEIVPYIDGTPAGTPRQADVVWIGETLHVDRLPKAKLARRVPEEIGKAFNRADIKAALDYSFERSATDVREYLEENFTLSAAVASRHELVDANAGKDSEPPEPSIATEDVDDVVDTPVSSEGEGDPRQQEAEASTEGRGDQEFEQVGVDHGETPRAGPRQPPKPAMPSIMERFAKAHGFRKDSDERFFHQNGSWIGRVRGEPFPWARHTASGDRVRSYWPKDHCLEREPLQLDADIWSLMEHYPETYALILSDTEGAPVEVSGAELRAMRDRRAVTLFPATYRLVYGQGVHV